MARGAPPPLRPRPVLRGGRRRSSLPRVIAIVAILAAPVAVAAAALLSLDDWGASGGASSPPLAVGSPPVAFAPTEPREPDAADRGGARAGRAAARASDAFHVQPAQAAARRARVRRGHRRGALAPQPVLTSPDGEPHEDHDRAARGGARPPGRPGPDHAGRPALPGLGRRPAAARASACASRRC